MIVVRDIFQLKFGKAKEAKAAWKEFTAIMKKHNLPPSRAFTDLTGPYYTFVLESTHTDLATFEQSLKNELGMKEFGEWYHGKFAPLVESGKREIYTVVE
jgi:hypothetical protein